MTETLQGRIVPGDPAGAQRLPNDGPDRLTRVRRQLHAAMAAGCTAEVDRLSALCFALLRRPR
jgi:hypothetical protein